MEKEVKLKRSLGLFQVVVAGTGIIIGAGIYALIGVASGIAGNAVWISFLISALVAMITGLSYCELSSMFSGDAGEYDYIKKALNRKFAFFIAMGLIIGTIISTSAVALGFAGYFTKFFPMSMIGAAILLIVIMTLINLWGIKETAWYNDIASIGEILGVLIIIVIGITKFGKVDYFVMPNGVNGIFNAAALVFFAYLGFESIVKLRDETKDPEKTIPKGIIYSIIISSILYVLAAVSAVSVLGWEKLSSSAAPMALVASAVFGNYAFAALAIMAMCATTNTVLLTIVAASRQLYGIAKEHSLPHFLSYVSPKTETPTFAILVSALFAIIFTSIGNIEIVANLTNVLLFLTFIVVNLSLIVLRYKEPDMHRGFKCPFNVGKFSIIASLGVLTSLVMMFFAVTSLI